jgi:hypothetical protein
VLLVMERTDSDENFLTISKFQMCQWRRHKIDIDRPCIGKAFQQKRH